MGEFGTGDNGDKWQYIIQFLKVNTVYYTYIIQFLKVKSAVHYPVLKVK